MAYSGYGHNSNNSLFGYDGGVPRTTDSHILRNLGNTTWEYTQNTSSYFTREYSVVHTQPQSSGYTGVGVVGGLFK
jgi:hypothetical protein